MALIKDQNFHHDSGLQKMTHSPTSNVRPITAASVLVIQNRKALIIQRGQEPSKGLWALPGGRQEAGELMEQTARRELLEETGLTATTLRFLQLIEPIRRNDQGEIVRHYVLAVYFCDDATGTLQAGDDAADAKWISLDQLDDYAFTGTSRQIIEQYLT